MNGKVVLGRESPATGFTSERSLAAVHCGYVSHHVILPLEHLGARVARVLLQTPAKIRDINLLLTCNGIKESFRSIDDISTQQQTFVFSPS